MDVFWSQLLLTHWTFVCQADTLQLTIKIPFRCWEMWGNHKNLTSSMHFLQKTWPQIVETGSLFMALSRQMGHFNGALLFCWVSEAFGEVFVGPAGVTRTGSFSRRGRCDGGSLKSTRTAPISLWNRLRRRADGLGVECVAPTKPSLHKSMVIGWSFCICWTKIMSSSCVLFVAASASTTTGNNHHFCYKNNF